MGETQCREREKQRQNLIVSLETKSWSQHLLPPNTPELGAELVLKSRYSNMGYGHLKCRILTPSSFLKHSTSVKPESSPQEHKGFTT